MKKKILMFLFAAVSLCAVGYAAQEVIKRASNDPCGKCNIAPENLKCGRCGSHKLWVHGKQKYENGYLHTNYKCEDCGHQCMHKERY